MANTKKYVSLDKLGLYDEKIKKVISDGDAASLTSAKSYADSLASNYDVVGAAATAEANAKAYADGKDAAIAEAKKAGTDAQAAAEAADAKAVTAQGEVDALETYVGAFTHDTAKTVVEYINAKTDGIATSGNLEALGNRVTAVEGDVATIKGDYLKAADKTELEGDIATVQTAVDTEKTRAEGIEAGLRTDVDAIKEDYLKAEDKTELQENIDAVSAVANAAVAKTVYDAKVAELVAEDTRIAGLVATEQARAEGVEAGLEERLVEVETFFKTTEGETLDTALDTLVEIQKYITDEGSAADQMVLDIAANAQAIADHVATDHDFATADATLKSELEGQIALKADKTTVEGIDGRVETLEGEMDTVQGKVSTLEGEMDAVEAAVATKVEQEAYNTKVAALEGADSAQVERIAALEAKFGEGEGSVADQIADAKQEAIDAAASAADTKDAAILAEAKKYADDEDAKIETRVDALETASATHALASDLTALAGRVTTAEGEIDTLQTEMDAVEALAAANKSAHEANAAAIALKASQTDLDNAVARIAANEAAIAAFVEVSEEEINALFA